MLGRVAEQFGRGEVMEHPLLESYGPLEGWHILLVLGTISIGFFTFQVQKAVRLVLILSLIHI